MHEWRDVPVAHPTHPTLPPPDSVVLDAAAGLKALTTGEALELDERGPRYLRNDGMVAPFVFDGPMNGPTFVTYIQQCLAPTLARRDTVIMDNLAAHKVAGVRQAIEAVGAHLRYLPQYSPDFNPIEQGFSKVKSKLRKAAERTIKGLCRRIGLISRSFNTQECANFFAHAGYG
jgi:transposase